MGSEFHQKWEFRRRDEDFDSSSNDSKSNSISEPTLKKHKLVASLISNDNDETSDSPAFQQNDKNSPEPEGQIKPKKARGRVKKNESVCNKRKQGTRKQVRRKKGKTGVCEPATPLDDVRVFMESLLEELKVKRENLLVWMREEMNKLVEDNISPRPTQERGSCVENAQLQHQNNNDETIEQQHGNNLEANVKTSRKKNVRSSKKAQNCNGGSVERSVKCKTEANQVDNGQSIGPRTSAQKRKRERLVLSASPHVQLNPPDQNVQMQLENSIDLGRNAQNFSGGSTNKAHEQIKTVDYGQPTRSVMSMEKDKGESSVLPIEQKFSSGRSNPTVLVQHQNSIDSRISSQKGKRKAESSNCDQVMENQVDYGQAGMSVKTNYSSDFSSQAASSMYLTLPTVLSEPHFDNNRIDTSSGSCTQPIIAGNKTGSNLRLGANVHCGYFPSVQQDERNGSFGQPQFGYRSPTLRIGTELPVQLQQGIVGGLGLPSQVNSILGLRINRGATGLSGVNHAILEQRVANNFRSQLNHRTNDDLTRFQNPESGEGHMFPK